MALVIYWHQEDEEALQLEYRLKKDMSKVAIDNGEEDYSQRSSWRASRLGAANVVPATAKRAKTTAKNLAIVGYEERE
jgi:hypothetical protein